jgi:hypothetical protein
VFSAVTETGEGGTIVIYNNRGKWLKKINDKLLANYLRYSLTVSKNQEKCFITWKN